MFIKNNEGARKRPSFQTLPHAPLLSTGKYNGTIPAPMAVYSVFL